MINKIVVLVKVDALDLVFYREEKPKCPRRGRPDKAKSEGLG